MSKEIKSLLRELENQGFTYRETGSGHYLVKAPGGAGTVTIPATPSDWRSWRNSIAALRKIGFTWKGR